LSREKSMCSRKSEIQRRTLTLIAAAPFSD